VMLQYTAIINIMLINEYY